MLPIIMINNEDKMKIFSLIAKEYIDNIKLNNKERQYLVQCTICGACTVIPVDTYGILGKHGFINLVCSNNLHGIFKDNEIIETRWKIIGEL